MLGAEESQVPSITGFRDLSFTLPHFALFASVVSSDFPVEEQSVSYQSNGLLLLSHA